MKSRRSGRAVAAGACLLLVTALVRAEDQSGAAAQPAGQDAASPVRPSRVSAQEAGKASTELLSLQNQIRQERSDALAKRKASQDTIRDLCGEKRMVSRSLDA